MLDLPCSVRIDSTDGSQRLRSDSVFAEGDTALPRWGSWRQTESTHFIGEAL
jgi:hypothetical protein